MLKFSSRIAISIILAGLFIIVSVIGAEYQVADPQSYSVLVMMSLLLVCYVVLFGAAMGYRHAEPVKKMLSSADEVSKGKTAAFSSIPRRLGYQDEVTELAQTLDQIMKDFERKKLQVEESKESAETKFKTKALLSEDVIRALETKVRNRTVQWQQAQDELQRLRSALNAAEQQVMTLNMQVEKLSKKKQGKKARTASSYA